MILNLSYIKSVATSQLGGETVKLQPFGWDRRNLNDIKVEED